MGRNAKRCSVQSDALYLLAAFCLVPACVKPARVVAFSPTRSWLILDAIIMAVIGKGAALGARE